MTKLYELHGLSKLERAPKDGDDSRQEVTVRDREGAVFLDMKYTAGFGARLTPDEARYLARCLNDAADRATAEAEANRMGSRDPRLRQLGDRPRCSP